MSMEAQLDSTNKVNLLLYIVTVIVSVLVGDDGERGIRIRIRITYFRVSFPLNRFHVPTEGGWRYLNV